MESIGLSSSLCSGTGRGWPCKNTSQILKKKLREDDGYNADIEDEAVVARKATPSKGGSCSERCRAARRRRRKKINQKLQELQKLIPNSDQILSMRAELYRLLTLPPPQMQQIQAAYVPCFSPMGPGMIVGVGIDSVAWVPVVQGTHFPGPSLYPNFAWMGL